MLSSGVSYLRVQSINNGEFEENKKYFTPTIDLTNVTEKVS
jgi:hypothetical protein